MKKIFCKTQIVLLMLFIFIYTTLHSQSSINVWNKDNQSLSNGAIHGQVWSNIGGPIKDALVFVTDPDLTHLYGEDISDDVSNWGQYWISPLPSNKDLVAFAYHPGRPFILASEKFTLSYNENKKIELDLSINYSDPGFIKLCNDFNNFGTGGVFHLSGFVLRMITLLQQSQNTNYAKTIIEQLNSLKVNNTDTSTMPTLGFILDSSGSMKDNDPNDIRKTALINIIKDRLTGTENVHIVDFDSEARLCNNNVSGWSEQDLINAVQRIDSSGGTNVEAGLDAMSASLTKNGFSNNTGVMLLTDGQGEYTDGAQWFLKNGIKVYTVSFVGETDEVLLMNIAQQTGGIYMRANTAKQICNLFNLFYDLLTGSSMFVYHKDQIHRGDVLEYYFPVDNVEGLLYFATNWAGSRGDMKIISPSGKIFTENEGSGQWNIGDTYITASIPPIEIGDWEVQLMGSQIPAQGGEVSLEVHGKSDLLFDVGMSALVGMVDFQINSIMKHLVSNYSTTVTVETPRGNEINISDKLQNDILYFFPASGKGSYKFTFIIKGNRNDGSKFQRLLTRYYVLAEIDGEASTYFFKGSDYLQDSLFDKALECFHIVIVIDPDYVGAYYGMGIIYVQKGNYNKAIECYKQIIEKDPTYPYTYFNMGNAYCYKGNYDKAISYYKKSIEIDPDYADAYYNMGVAYAKNCNYDKAIEGYQGAIELDPDYAEANNNMGIAYANKGNYGKAISYYKKSIEIDPNYAKAYYNMGVAYADNGNYEKAIECFLRSIEIDPDYADAYFNMGNAYYDKVNYDKAIECYQGAIEIYPTYPYAYLNMGNAYYDKGNYDKAIECYKRSIEIDTDYSEAYFNMGNAYARKGWDMAAADSFYQAGLLYFNQNNNQEVLKTIDAMKTKTPDSPLIQKLMDKLNKE